jgi:hypothetical protein
MDDGEDCDFVDANRIDHAIRGMGQQFSRALQRTGFAHQGKTRQDARRSG